MNDKQFGKVSKEYENISKNDPSKQFVQYPNMLMMMGSVKGRNILDVGCGNGILSRELAQRGAKVVGYDIAESQIEIARMEEKRNPLGIEYIVSDADTIEDKTDKKFDSALACLVLLYSKDKSVLGDFFESTYNLLNDQGIFNAITFNPDYKKLGIPAYNRVITRNEDGMNLDFLNNSGEVSCSVSFSDFSRQDYENAAREAGFKRFNFVPLKISEGFNKPDEDFWKDYEFDCPYVGLRASKHEPQSFF